jgi:sulfoxide reductase heme-binding subunit YedZ
MSTWGYLARSSGIVAAVLAVASLVWGFLFSARETGNRLRPAWWLDLHNWLGGIALLFTGVHIGALLIGNDYGITLKEVLVPGAAKYQTGDIAWGVLAFYMFTVIVVTSWRPVKKFISRKVWYAIHLVSLPAIVLMFVHGYSSGPDNTARWFKIGTVALVGLALYPAVLRLTGLLEKRKQRAH